MASLIFTLLTDFDLSLFKSVCDPITLENWAYRLNSKNHDSRKGLLLVQNQDSNHLELLGVLFYEVAHFSNHSVFISEWIFPDLTSQVSKLFSLILDKTKSLATDLGCQRMLIYSKNNQILINQFLKESGFQIWRSQFQLRKTLNDFEFKNFSAKGPSGTHEFSSQLTSIQFLKLADLDLIQFGPSIYSLENELLLDIPNQDYLPRVSLEQFLDVRLKTSEKNCSLVAIYDQVPVGLCMTRKKGAGLHIWMTGIKTGFREKGFAKILKLNMLNAAKESGYPWVESRNDQENMPILKLNQSLGFEITADRIHFGLNSLI